eukprot:CAMPEP_0185589644 /NCGR_PEP_ID=MMETSP0434-20130131/57847_1 /TAXON_ID=626734 ORGANISM="Favella taraikaensis, Strain Fe Narragansett Bay" /NCGR_SAMPLE_ID=MMETSP0434 /ASSEMBLY_ACC=CAM_ASM_000379 /LENGTH=73 /DNA_ID=CAMNT_0028213237 /DNA_START=97 /DNA_END=318 /DNA_ORIENTATION=-
MTESLDLQMESVREFCQRVDRYNIKSFNFLQYFKELGIIDSQATRLRELTPEERANYDRLYEEEMIDRYESNW